MKVYCNPYHHLDHKGRLAGACPWDPGHAAGARRHVQAEIRKVGEIERKDDDPRPPKDDHAFFFDPEPLTVPGGPPWYYNQQARDGGIFAPRDGKPPIEQWRAARAKAIADWTIAYGSPPDTSTWAEQFPLDAEIAAPAKDEVRKAPGGKP